MLHTPQPIDSVTTFAPHVGHTSAVELSSFPHSVHSVDSISELHSLIFQAVYGFFLSELNGRLWRPGMPADDTIEEYGKSPIHHCPKKEDENPAHYVWWGDHPLVSLKSRKTNFTARPEWKVDCPCDESRKCVNPQEGRKESQAQVGCRENSPNPKEFSMN